MAIIKSIHWEPTNRDNIVWKYPSKEITLGSVLTVNESQEALFFKNGALCDTFGAGRHVLSTSNLPILSKFVNLASGGETTFQAEVWFVSKLDKRDMYWGTGGLRIIDPYFGIPIKLSSRGQYGIRIMDSSMFMKKFIGTFANVSTDLIDDQLRIDVVEAVRVNISSYMKENNVNVNELGVSYRELAKTISKALHISFEEYGIELLNFNIESIDFDEKDKGYQAVMDGIAERARLDRLGISYADDKKLDIAQTAAGNEGAGTYMGVGMGFGMGNALGNVVGGSVSNSVGASVNNPGPQVPPPPPQASFYVAKNGQTVGPFAMDALRQMVGSGEINRETYVYKVGGTAWVKATDAAELAQLFALMPPPPPTM